MTKFNLLKKIAIALVLFSFVLPIQKLLAAETTPASTPASPPPPECTVDTSKMTEAQKVEQRKKCDAAQLKKDQENLQKIRQEEDVKKAAEFCKSEYAPKQDKGGNSSGGGQFVPVHETGQLLTLTKSTNKLTMDIDGFTGKSYDMNIKLCMYLQAIKRVQYAMEDLTFVQEPDMRRQAATKVSEYKEGLLGKKGLIQTGYSPSGEITEPPTSSTPGSDSANGESLYPKNLETYIDDNKKEASGQIYDTLSQSNNSFGVEVKGRLQMDEAIQGREAFTSTIKREDYDVFMSGGNGMTSDKWWKTFTGIFDVTRPNNPNNAYLLAQNTLNLAKNEAAKLALEEYSAGSGFLPTRKCAVYTSDGKYCSHWETDTPGQIVLKAAGDAIATNLETYLHPELGQVGNGNEPTTNEVQTFTPSAGTGGGSAGGTGGGNNNGSDSIDSDNDGTPDNIDQDDDNDGIPDNEDDNTTVNKPVVMIWANNNIFGTRIISWGSSGADSCYAQNDWLGSTDENTKQVVKLKSGSQQIENNGSITSYTPLSFQASWSKNGGAFTTLGMTTSTNVASTSLKYVWTLPTSILATDQYTLKIQDGISDATVSIGSNTDWPISALTASQLVNLFRSADPSTGAFSRYDFTYNSTGQSPNIVIELTEPVYQINCLNAGGSSSDSTD